MTNQSRPLLRVYENAIVVQRMVSFAPSFLVGNVFCESRDSRESRAEASGTCGVGKEVVCFLPDLNATQTFNIT